MAPIKAAHAVHSGVAISRLLLAHGEPTTCPASLHVQMCAREPGAVEKPGASAAEHGDQDMKRAGSGELPAMRLALAAVWPPAAEVTHPSQAQDGTSGWYECERGDLYSGVALVQGRGRFVTNSFQKRANRAVLARAVRWYGARSAIRRTQVALESTPQER